MSIFKRAFLYVTQKRGKTILLFAILLIMATFVLTGLSIWKASEAAQLDLRQSLEGSVLFDGEDITAKGLEHHRRNHISLIFQSYNLIDYMTPIENVRLTAQLDAAPILERLGLEQDEIARNVLKLSSRQQQRVAITRALASDAPVILADEPTGNLDADTAEEITAILKESTHAFGKCVVVVTHSGEVARQADVVLEIKRGHLKKREM